MRRADNLAPLLLRTGGVLALVAACGAFACNEKGTPGMMVRPQQSFVLELRQVVTAERACANWAWAAALETALRQQDVEIKQDFWVVRAHGGLVCMPRAGEAAELARATEGSYVLADGRRVRLEARYHHGAPASVDDLILRLRTGSPFLLFWNSQVYLLYGVTYDEYIAPTGERLFQVRRLNLLDLDPQARERETLFDREQHDPAAIEAVMEVVAHIEQGTDWLRQRSN